MNFCIKSLPLAAVVLAFSLTGGCRSDLRQGDDGQGGSTVGHGGTSEGGAAGRGGAVGTGGTPGPAGGAGGALPDSGVAGTGVTGSGGVTSSGGHAGTPGSLGGQAGQAGSAGSGGIPSGSGGMLGSGGIIGSGGTAALALGSTCTSGSQCSSGVCADGVCCNGVCSGQCEACNSASAKGTCVAVTTPRTACAGTGTCGGHCDGTNRAACSYPASTVSCGAAASCSSSKATTAALCNGAGLCTSSVTTTCTYGCRSDAPLCETGCPTGQALCGGSCVDVLSTAAHCGDSCTACQGTTPKCLSGACVQCTTGNDCSTGQVCSSNHICQCRAPSPTNVVLNPGFDASVGGGLGNWTPSTTYAATFSTDDVDGCSGSGSAQVAFVVAANHMDKDFGQISQCVTLASGSSYYLGYRYKQVGDTALCELWYYTGAGCMGSPISTIQVPSNISGDVTTWGTQSTQISTPTGTGSGLLICRMLTSGSGSFDQIYINSNVNGY